MAKELIPLLYPLAEFSYIFPVGCSKAGERRIFHQLAQFTNFGRNLILRGFIFACLYDVADDRSVIALDGRRAHWAPFTRAAGMPSHCFADHGPQQSP